MCFNALRAADHAHASVPNGWGRSLSSPPARLALLVFFSLKSSASMSTTAAWPLSVCVVTLEKLIMSRRVKQKK